MNGFALPVSEFTTANETENNSHFVDIGCLQDSGSVSCDHAHLRLVIDFPSEANYVQCIDCFREGPTATNETRAVLAFWETTELEHRILIDANGRPFCICGWDPRADLEQRYWPVAVAV